MCTVTLVSLPDQENGFILTSNRDEEVVRKTLPPQEYLENGVPLLFPKDELAGGTWIGISEKRRAICLLNGGFEKHIRKPPYRKSRGLVVKELLTYENLIEEVEKYNLQGIEPFTCVIVEWKGHVEIHELVWDGLKRHLKQLPAGSYIWSSSLLYTKDVAKARREKFQRFLDQEEKTSKNLLDFHTGKGAARDQSLIINKGFLKTCSVTQITNSNSTTTMYYQNLLKDEEPVLSSLSKNTR